MRMKKIISLVLVTVLLAFAVPLTITSVAASEKKIPCDDGDNELTKEELVNAILPHMLGEEDLKLDDVGDAAYVYAYWDGKPRTITDSSERTVTMYKPAERVVSNSIDDLRVLCALGAVNKIVGRPDYVDKYAEKLMPVQAHPEIKDVPSVGGYKTPNLELMVALKPDVIFAYGGSASYVDVADGMQEKTGIPVVTVKHSTEGYKFDLAVFGLVGEVVGKEERAEELIAYANEEINKLSEITSGINKTEKPRVYFFSAHGATFIERAVPCYGPIDVAGGINVVGEELPGCSVVEVSLEEIIDWNPDIILVHSFSKEPSISLESILSDNRLQCVNAVKNESVYYIKGFYIGWDPGSGVAESFYLAKIFHPDKFKVFDVEKEGNEIFKEFYGADGLYTYMLEYVGNYYTWE